MLEWLQTILEGAAVTDGKLDVAAVMNTVKTEFPKNAVPKTDFNAKVNELKTANETITSMKKDAGDNADLQKKIGEYEEQIKTLQKEAADTAKTYALKAKLTEAGALDPDYLIYKQGGLEKFNFDKDGNPVGVDDIVKPLKESTPHLFKSNDGQGGYNPAAGGSGSAGGSNPWKKETYNLTEQGRILKSDPIQAKQLAAAAGVTLNI
jgi:hypothetical protein